MQCVLQLTARSSGWTRLSHVLMEAKQLGSHQRASRDLAAVFRGREGHTAADDILRMLLGEYLAPTCLSSHTVVALPDWAQAVLSFVLMLGVHGLNSTMAILSAAPSQLRKQLWCDIVGVVAKSAQVLAEVAWDAGGGPRGKKAGRTPAEERTRISTASATGLEWDQWRCQDTRASVIARHCQLCGTIMADRIATVYLQSPVQEYLRGRVNERNLIIFLDQCKQGQPKRFANPAATLDEVQTPTLWRLLHVFIKRTHPDSAPAQAVTQGAHVLHSTVAMGWFVTVQLGFRVLLTEKLRL